MDKYFHSVRLERTKCSGCTNCIKRCPTEAIRVQNGKAKIMDERCIDCGECIRVSPYHAKYALTDTLSAISKFKYKIALPAPALFSQFKGLRDLSKIIDGLRRMGFDDVFEVARGAEVVSAALRKRLEKDHIKPLISSACPAVTRLIQVRFPELLDHIVDVQAPVEVAAKLAKKEFAERNGVDIKDIGVYFITPCPAKMTAIISPLGKRKSDIDGAISILEIYGLIAGQLKFSENADKKDLPDSKFATAEGVLWANSTGEMKSTGEPNSLAVCGILNVIKALDDIDNDKLSQVDFFEGLACPGGCVGGPLVFESSFVAYARLNNLSRTLPEKPDYDEVAQLADTGIADMETDIEPLNVMELDSNISEAARKLQRIYEIEEKLPGKDCGSCGSPTCRSLAEDIVLGYANELDCVFLMREKVRYLAEEMVGLASKDGSERE